MEAEQLLAVFEGIVYGDDARITPHDRLQAAQQLRDLTSGESDPDLRGLLGQLSAAELDAEWDRYMGTEIVRKALAGEEATYPLMAAAIRKAVAERAELRARELADADRIEREIEERAHRLAEELYRERSFQLVRVTDASRPSDPPAQPPGRVEESAAPQASTAPPPGVDLSRGWPRRGGGRAWRRWPHE